MDLNHLRIPLLVLFISLLSSFTFFSPPLPTGSFTTMNNGIDNVVNEVIFAPNGDIYATGSFATVDGGTLYTNGIAKWDGTSWSAFGTGLNSSGRALVFDSVGNLYIGGSFTSVDGISANRVAKWDGTNWSALGLGLNLGGAITEMEIDANDNLIVAGNFPSVDGVACNSIAKWDGTNWSALGTGLDDSVFGLDIAPNGDIVVCGLFSSAGGIPVNDIALWNGTSWSGMGNQDLNGVAYEILVAPNGKVYVSGGFTNEGINVVNRIIEWDGSSWSNMGSGLDATGFALAADYASNIFVGGAFSNAGGTSASGVAMWDGTTWNAFGTGVNPSVNSVDTDIVGDFVVGGTFSMAGGITANRIAKWSGVFLSVELNSFEAKANDESVHLNWETSSEDKLLGFEIQRSTDGVNWSKIGFQESQGSSESDQSYRFIDSSPSMGISYYRLHMNNLEGGNQVSEIRTVKMEKQEIISVFPNPSNGVFQIRGDFSEPVPFQLFDSFGRLKKQGVLQGPELNITDLANGVYWLSFPGSNAQESISLIKK